MWLMLFMNRFLQLGSGLWLSAAALGGLLAAVAYRRLRAVRLFLSFLFPAVFVFLGAFVSSPAIWPLLSEEASYGAELPDIEIKNPLPVVLVVFDELPLQSLLNHDGEIDSERFPSFAAMARESTWYRQASVVADTTRFSIPSIVSGRYPDPATGGLPTYAHHPETLFTLLGREYRVRSFESVTALCPRAVCTPENLRFGPRFLATILDVGVLYLHLILPSSLAESVPAVNQTWGNFVRVAALDFALQRRPVEEFSSFIDKIRPDSQPTLHFLHSNLPHVPWVYMPSGKQYLPWRINYHTPIAWGNELTLVAMGWQRHLFQVLLADRLLGDLVRHLRTKGVYDRTLLVVASDHGASFRPGELRRNLTAENYPDIMSVPLLIKFPYQKTGRASNQHAETIDIVPTLADVLGARIPWPVDGKSLLDDSGADSYRRVVPADGRIPLIVSSDLTSYLHPVVCRGGEAVAAQPGQIAAYLDLVEDKGETVLFFGWAADLEASQPADTILVFVNGRNVHEGTTDLHRPDVVRVHFDQGLTTSGFVFEVDSDLFDSEAQVRVFAVRGDRISEVIYPNKFPWKYRLPREFKYVDDLAVQCDADDEATLHHAVSAFADKGGDFLEKLQRMARTADREGLFRFAPCSRLVGQIGTEASFPSSTSLVATFFQNWRYEQVDPDGPYVPAGVRGWIRAEPPVGRMPPQVAVSVNGLIQGVAPTFTSPAGEVEFLVLVSEKSFRAGPNQVELFAVDDLEACTLKRVPRR